MGWFKDLSDYYKSLPPKDRKEFAGAIGILGGLALNKLYDVLPPEDQAKWKEKRPLKMHHGDLGYIVAKYGNATKNPAIVEFGKNLRETDRRDENEWIFKAEKRQDRKPVIVTFKKKTK